MKNELINHFKAEIWAEISSDDITGNWRGVKKLERTFFVTNNELINQFDAEIWAEMGLGR